MLQSASSTTTTVAGPSAGQVKSALYYVNDGSLLPQISELSDRGLQTVLTANLQPPQAGSEVVGTLSSIPTGTRLLSLRQVGDTLTVNLSTEFNNVVGLSRQQAIGQLVLAATERAAVGDLNFEINGEPIQVSTPTRGDASTVSDCDFAPLLATQAQAASAELDPESGILLDVRRSGFASDC
ncbi:MAG: GerMN domain-containing protein [Microthrixaceae bacterium]